MMREPLDREEVIRAIERKGGSRIPLVFHKWWGKGLKEKYGEKLVKIADEFPDDIFVSWYKAPGEEISTNSNKSYRWGYRENYSDAARHSIGNNCELLPDWKELDSFMMDFPDPNEPGTFDTVEKELNKAGERYKLGCFWRLFHERLWSIRGMENLMIDYYENMDELKLIGKQLVEYYKVIVDRFAHLGFDGIFSSDDLGHQQGPMMSPAIFEELYHPLYKELVSYVHNRGMHMFLHSCGDNSKLIDFLIDSGLDVFHPVQKGCMNEIATAKLYGERISFLAGVDVQYLLPQGSVTEVRAGVRELIDIFYKPCGGLLLAAGNGIMQDTPMENIEAMLIEMAMYK